MSESLLPPVAERSTMAGRVRHRLRSDPRAARLATMLAAVLVTLLAAILRFAHLAHPDSLAFDETYYVKDAWSLWTQGYEGVWAKGVNPDFAAGDTSGLGTQGSFVVHPPLGKWIIALGMGLFGQDSSFGWRFSVAVLGTLTVPLLFLVVRRLTRSTVWAAVAGLLLAVDGLAIVLSRIGLLDGILTFLLLLALWFLVLDRRHAALPPAIPRDAGLSPIGAAERPPMWGPVLWRRPWLLAAGLALGAASAVKWSGLYALAGFGLYLVVSDALARRRAGIVLWPQAAVLKQGPASFLLLVPPALFAYLASWTGWLVTSGGYDRDSADNPVAALWTYHQAIYRFHVGLSSPHTYESPAWQWPLLLRPTAIWVGGQDGPCLGDHCIGVITAVPNPLIWYGGVLAALWLLFALLWRGLVRPLGRRSPSVRLFSRRGIVRRAPLPPALTLPLLGLAVTYLPWLLYPERTIFQFYTVVMAPYLVIALTLALRALAGTAEDPLYRRQAGERTVAVILVAILAISAFFLPLWLGLTVPYDFWRLHAWQPGWV